MKRAYETAKYLHRFFTIVATVVPEPQQQAEERSASKEMIERMSKAWSKRAGVMDYDSTGATFPAFDLDKDDFLEKLLPFHNHPTYVRASEEIKKRILTYGWILYNQKTVALESSVVTPACLSILDEKVPGLKDQHSKRLASESMMDESYHTTLVNDAIAITEENRHVYLEKQTFNLVKKMQEAQDGYAEPWKKTLILLVTAIVSEIFISDYLNLLSDSPSVQPFNRVTVEAHRKDELNHSKIFKAFAKELYTALNQEEKKFFAAMLPKPIYWFADKDLEVWENVLQQMGFEGAEEMIASCQKDALRYLECINYSGIVELARDINVPIDIEGQLLRLINEDVNQPPNQVAQAIMST